MHTLLIDGMTCSHCVSRITRTLMELDSSAKVEVELATKTVRLTSGADLDQVTLALEEAGYSAVPFNPD